MKGYEKYTYKGTEYLTIKTKDGWLYRFERPSKEEEGCPPFQFEKKQRADGTWSPTDDRLPDNVVEFIETAFDAADLNARPSNLRE